MDSFRIYISILNCFNLLCSNCTYQTSTAAATSTMVVVRVKLIGVHVIELLVQELDVNLGLFSWGLLSLARSGWLGVVHGDFTKNLQENK